MADHVDDMASGMADLHLSDAQGSQQNVAAADHQVDSNSLPQNMRMLSDSEPLTNAEANAAWPVTFGASVLVSKDEHTGLLTIPRFRRLLQNCEICEVPTRNRCSKCQRMAYCCEAHQKQDWQRHKLRECKQMAIKRQHFLDVRQQAVDAAPGQMEKFKDQDGPLKLHFCFVFPEGKMEPLDYQARNHAVTF